MSVEEIQQIIRRSVIDRAFAKALYHNFYEAVREYNLTAIEKAALRAMQIEFDNRRTKRHRAGRASPPKSRFCTRSTAGFGRARAKAVRSHSK